MIVNPNIEIEGSKSITTGAVHRLVCPHGALDLPPERTSECGRADAQGDLRVPLHGARLLSVGERVDGHGVVLPAGDNVEPRRTT